MEAAENNKYTYLDKIDCSDLREGMFVQELDRPWLETSFMFQGFYIKNAREIEELKKYCEFVYVNRERSEIDPKIYHRIISGNLSADTQATVTTRIPLGTSTWHDSDPVEKELEKARTVYEESSAAIESLFGSAGEEGVIDAKEASKTTTGIVDSVLRNPDAFMLLQRMKSRDQYRYTHAINSCALAATFCRHLGFSKDEILDISMGALMLDVGTIKLPESLLEMTEPLNPLSIKMLRHHVQFGM